MNDLDRSAHYLPYLQRIPAFATLDEAPVSYLAGGGLLRSAPRGQILCEKGSRSITLQCLIEGRVKLVVLSPRGSERVLDILLPGRLFGLATVLLDEPCPVIAESISDCQLLSINRERVQAAIGIWPEVATTLLDLLARDVHRLIHDLESCCLMSARQRLADFLVKQGRCLAREGEDQVTVTLHAAKSIVASTLNLSAETFSRELHELAARGLIEIDRRRILIPSLERLGGFLAEAAEIPQRTASQDVA